MCAALLCVALFVRPISPPRTTDPTCATRRSYATHLSDATHLSHGGRQGRFARGWNGSSGRIRCHFALGPAILLKGWSERYSGLTSIMPRQFSLSAAVV